MIHLLHASAAIVILAAAFPRAAGADGLRKEGPIRIELRPTAVAAGPFILLDEIAELSSGPPGLRAFAGAILFGFSPENGARREIEASDVEARLRQSGIPEDWFVVEGAPRTTVYAGKRGEVRPSAKRPSDPGGSRRPSSREAAPAGKEPRAPLTMRPVPMEEVLRNFRNRTPLPGAASPTAVRPDRTPSSR